MSSDYLTTIPDGAIPLFEQIRRVDEDGYEYWSARELAKVLEYREYRNFRPALERAMEACSNSGFEVSDHFVEMHDMIKLGSGAETSIQNMGKYKANANQAHYEVGKKVRKTIQELGGTMPENLPAAESIKKIEQKAKKLNKGE